MSGEEEKNKKRSFISDFCVWGTEETRTLSSFERLTLIGGRELDKAIAWFAKQLSRFNYLDQFGTLDVSELKEVATYYDRAVLRSDPGSFFQLPMETPLVGQKEIHGLEDGSIVDLEFPSSYLVQYPGVSDYFDSFSSNRVVHTRFWKHASGPRPTIIAVHGWTMGDQRINSLAFQPGFFYSQGYDIALFELPFHGRRAPLDAPPLFPSTNFIMTNESIAQAIFDLRQLRLFLKSQGVQVCGVLGMSLGAYVAALWSGLDALDFCIPIVPLVSMSDLAWDIVSRDEKWPLYSAQGIRPEMFESVYFVHSPLSFTPKIDRDRLMIVAGLSDAVVPPTQAKGLWNHWQRPRIHWFEGGHIAEFKKSRAFVEISRFFVDIGIKPS